MFDPDNFYEILKHWYSYPRTPNYITYFRPHGSKNLKDTHFLGSDEDRKILEGLGCGKISSYGRIVLHDQEPFSIDIGCTYADYLQQRKFHETLNFIKSLSATEQFNCYLKSGLLPILCHSEINSTDIKEAIEGCLVIDCYYWYHGMIARDWFRHWQHHADLMPKDRSDTKYRFMMYARGLDGSRSYRNQFIDMMRVYADKILYSWQEVTQKNITPDYSAKISVEDANLASVHIVLETLFDTQKIHLTEKVFKPMVMSQPFFLLSGPGSLKYLRDYGFKTFGKFWDESYDDITESHQRMIKIENEIKHLISMPTKEFQDLYKSLLPLIDHNRKHFYSQEFQDTCIKEMRVNFQQSLDKQKENLHIYPGGTWPWTLNRLCNQNLSIPSGYRKLFKEFLSSEYLSVSPEEILTKYPILRTLI